MKAIAVYPGKPNSMHLEEIPMPRVTDIPGGCGVLVKVLRVGVDGTDKEINAAEYGSAPDGEKFLITGHENFGQVMEVGPNVPDTITPGTYVVATVRRPGQSIYDQIGLQDMTTDSVYYERGSNLRHGYLTEYYVEDAAYMVTLPATLREVGVLLERTTVAEKGLNQPYDIQSRGECRQNQPGLRARQQSDGWHGQCLACRLCQRGERPGQGRSLLPRLAEQVAHHACPWSGKL